MSKAQWPPKQSPPLDRRDRVAMVGIFLLTLALFVSTQTPSFNDYDEVQFAMAVRDQYDIAQHLPHPPGYPLLILFGRWLMLLTGDAMRALTLLSAIGGAVSVMSLWWLAWIWWPKRPAIAWLASGWLVVTPHIWLGSIKALGDVPTLAFHCASVAFAWRGLWSWRWRVGATALVAIGLGIRVQNAAGLIPPLLLLMAMSGWTQPRGGRAAVTAVVRVCVHIALLLALCAAWFVGMLYATGGYDAYWSAVHDYSAFRSQLTLLTGTSGGFSITWWLTRLGFHVNTVLVAMFGFYLAQFTQSQVIIVWLPAFAALVGLLVLIWRVRSPRAVTAIVWGLPHFLFVVALHHPLNPRYPIPSLPPLILYASAGLVLWGARREVKLLIAAPVAIWLVFVTTWAVKVIRTQPSPLVESVHWVIEHHGADLGYNFSLIDGDGHRYADYITDPAPPGSPPPRCAALIAEPGVEPVWIGITDGIVDQREFERPLIPHPKHHHLVATIYRLGPVEEIDWSSFGSGVSESGGNRVGAWEGR